MCAAALRGKACCVRLGRAVRAGALHVPCWRARTPYSPAARRGQLFRLAYHPNNQHVVLQPTEPGDRSIVLCGQQGRWCWCGEGALEKRREPCRGRSRCARRVPKSLCTPCTDHAYTMRMPGKVSPRSSCTRVVSNVKRYLGGASVKKVPGGSVARTLNTEHAVSTAPGRGDQPNHLLLAARTWRQRPPPRTEGNPV